MEGGREQNYWPGFVDALSNVVLTLVFVLVIFVFALVIASNKVEQKMQELASKDQTVQQATQAPPAPPPPPPPVEVEKKNEELKQELMKAQTEIKELREEIIKSAAEKQSTGSTSTTAINDTPSKESTIEVKEQAPPKPVNGSVSIRGSQASVVVGYPSAVTQLDDKASAELGHVLAAMKQKFSGRKVTVRSIIGKEPFSAARRYAYYRAIGARNYLITNQIAANSDINSILVQPPTPEDGRVEIVFEHQ